MATSSCAEVAGFEDFERGAPQQKSHRCDVLVDPHDTGTRQSNMKLVKLAGDTCFWVDQTEVTVKQYENWVEAHPGFSDWNQEYCLWKTSLSNPSKEPQDTCRLSIPADDTDPWNLARPIRCVDWCDAEAFCRSYDAVLCTRTLPPYEPYGANLGGEWRHACASTGLYPWGTSQCSDCCNAKMGAICNTPTFTECHPRPVSELLDCVTAEGVFDILGNVREWVRACIKVDPNEPSGKCLAAGGSFVDNLADLTCDTVQALPRSTRDEFTGFRCCAMLSTLETGKLPLP